MVNTISQLSLQFGGVASFPNFPPPNNFVAIAHNSFDHVLAHELGHYLGLLHTHDGNNYFNLPNNSCQLLTPSIDGDMIADTPVDPGPNSVCIAPCNAATQPCTLTCDNCYFDLNPQGVGVPATFTYPAGYLTNNIMSYHFCPNRQLTQGQKDRMNTILSTQNSSRYFLNTPPTCNNEIAEDGIIRKYCQTSNDVCTTPLENMLVDIKNETTNWQGSAQSNTDGVFGVHQQNLSNQASVSVRPKASHPLILTNPDAVSPNYQPSNGVTVYDIFLLHSHILGMEPLSNPYNWIAADVNNSGSITTFDITQIRKIILGLQPDFLVGTYRFIPEHYLANATFASDFENNPFTASYFGLGYPAYIDSDLSLDMDDATVADPSTWSYVAVKVGDVNCSMIVEDQQPCGEGQENTGLITTTQGAGPCLSVEDILTVEVDASNIEDAVSSYQLGLTYDKDKLTFLGIAPGDIPDFKFDNFVVKAGEIRTLWYKDDAGEEMLDDPKTLFKMHFKVKSASCNVNQAIALDDETLPGMFFNNKSQSSVAADLTFNWAKNVESPKGRITSVYPNPASNNLSFNFHLDQAATVAVNVWDFQGNSISYEYAYGSGDHTYTFGSIASLSAGPLNYTLKIDNFTYSGIAIKSPN